MKSILSVISQALWEQKKVLHVFICILIGISSTEAQDDLHFSHIGIDDGLSQSTVLEVFMDHIGFVWFGTRTCLDRYDGISVEKFLQDPEDSLSINFGFIASIVEDQGGDFWIGSKGGLYHYDRSVEKFSRFQYIHGNKTSIGSNDIIKLAVDKSNRLWICHSQGLDMLDVDRKSFFHVFEELNTQWPVGITTLFGITEDKHGRIWVSTDKHIHQVSWDKKLIRSYQLPVGDNDSPTIFPEIELFTSSKGKVWAAGTTGKVFSYREKDDKIIRELEGIIPEYGFTCIDEDSKGNLLLGTNSNGLLIYDETRGLVSHYTHNENNSQSLSNNHIQSIFKDRNDVIWVGTWNGGINYTNESSKNFKWVSKKRNNSNSLINNNVTTLFEDLDNNIWIGTSKGISLWNIREDTFMHFAKKGCLPEFTTECSVNSFLEFSPKRIWAGTSNPGGIFEISLDGLVVEPVDLFWDTDDILKEERIYTLDKDLNGFIWIGTTSGIYRIDYPNQTIRSYNTANSGLRSNLIRSSYIDSKGLIWFGTSAGLFMYDSINDDFIHKSSFILDFSDSPQWIFSIFEDKLGQFWVGTAGYGLVLYDRETDDWERFTTKDGLQSNVITSIVEDDAGNLWISSYKGIVKFSSLQKTVLHNYDTNDGLISVEFKENCQLKTTNQKILFGGIYGFTVFNPVYFSENPNAPNIVFKELRIANKTLKPGQKKSPLKVSLSQTTKFSLSHFQKPFSISFAALNLMDAPKNKYLCLLEGYDENWYSPVTKGIVHFDNLKPGKYTFHVKASNNDGIWNEEGISLQIRILPPWWFSIWAWGIYTLIFIGLLLFYARLVKNREIEKQIAQGERKEKEKIRELNKARLQFFTEIAHDFKTPLSLIISPIEQLNRYHSNDKNFERLLGLISRNAKRLNYLSGELMTFRKLEMGQINLEKHDRDFVSFIQQIIYEFIPLINRKKIHFNFNYDNSPVNLSFDEERMERVICNLLDNAIKYTAVEGTIRIDIESKPEVDEAKTSSSSVRDLIIRVFNSGHPFSNEDLERIFDRFYQGGKLRKPGFGHGIGLPLVKGLVELHQGSIEVRNITDEGKEFVIRLPMSTAEWEFMSTHQTETVAAKEIGPLEHNIKSEVLLENHDQNNSNNSNNNNGDRVLPLLLLVEDNDEFREYLGSNLNQNFRIISASDGSQGFVKAIKNMPDLIISDIMMPVMDGLELCKKIKEDIRTSHIPVILLTSKAEIEHRIQGLGIGADAYLTKPFVNKHLEIQIHNLIKNRLLLASKFSSPEPYSPEEVHTSKIDQEFLNKAISFIQNNVAEDNLGIDLLSSHLCVSRRHLHRKIKVLTGSSPVEFINVLRLRKSMELLKQNKLSISEIGYMVGFSNPSYFAQSFKKLYGHPPSFFVK